MSRNPLAHLDDFDREASSVLLPPALAPFVGDALPLLRSPHVGPRVMQLWWGAGTTAYPAMASRTVWTAAHKANFLQIQSLPRGRSLSVGWVAPYGFHGTVGLTHVPDGTVGALLYVKKHLSEDVLVEALLESRRVYSEANPLLVGDEPRMPTLGDPVLRVSLLQQVSKRVAGGFALYLNGGRISGAFYGRALLPRDTLAAVRVDHERTALAVETQPGGGVRLASRVELEYGQPAAVLSSVALGCRVPVAAVKGLTLLASAQPLKATASPLWGLRYKGSFDLTVMAVGKLQGGTVSFHFRK